MSQVKAPPAKLLLSAVCHSERGLRRGGRIFRPEQWKRKSRQEECHRASGPFSLPRLSSLLSRCTVWLCGDPCWFTCSRLLQISKCNLTQQPQLTEMNSGWLRGDGVWGSLNLLPLHPPTHTQLALQNPQGTRKQSFVHTGVTTVSWVREQRGLTP